MTALNPSLIKFNISHVILKPFLCHSYVVVWHSYVICMSILSDHKSSVCTPMSFVCQSYVLICHTFVTRGYSYVIRMILICTRLSSVCHSYVIACHLYVTRIWFYHEPCLNAFIQKAVFYIIAILVKEVFFLSSLKKHRQLSTKYTQNMYCNMG